MIVSSMLSLNPTSIAYCCLALYHHTHTPRAYVHASREATCLTHGHSQLYESLVALLFVVFVWSAVLPCRFVGAEYYIIHRLVHTYRERACHPNPLIISSIHPRSDDFILSTSAFNHPPSQPTLINLGNTDTTTVHSQTGNMKIAFLELTVLIVRPPIPIYIPLRGKPELRPDGACTHGPGRVREVGSQEAGSGSIVLHTWSYASRKSRSWLPLTRPSDKFHQRNQVRDSVSNEYG